MSVVAAAEVAGAGVQAAAAVEAAAGTSAAQDPVGGVARVAARSGGANFGCTRAPGHIMRALNSARAAAPSASAIREIISFSRVDTRRKKPAKPPADLAMWMHNCTTVFC